MKKQLSKKQRDHVWKHGLPAKQAEKAAGAIVDKALGMADEEIEKARAGRADPLRVRPPTNAELAAHPILSDAQRRICKELRDVSKRNGETFTLLDFARIALRATGNNYAAVDDEDGLQAAVCDAEHQRAALLFAYELVRNGPPIVAETLQERGTLHDIEIVARHL